jgi:hypothetical protein
MLLAFEKAHTGAQQLLIEVFGPQDKDTGVVTEESRACVRKARKMRKHMDQRLTNRVTTEHLAARILVRSTPT